MRTPRYTLLVAALLIGCSNDRTTTAPPAGTREEPARPPDPAKTVEPAGADADAPNKVGCLRFTIPPGWRSERSEQAGSDVVIRSEKKFKVGSVEKADRFTIGVAPSRGQTLDAYVEKVRKTFEAPSTDHVNEVTRSRTGGSGAIDGFGPVTMKPLQLGGVPAYAIDGTSTIRVESLTLTYRGPRVFTLFRDQLYIVAARYSVERQSEVGPIADAFVASLRLDGCGG